MRRTPAIISAKLKWRLKFEAVASAEDVWSPSNAPAGERQGFLEKRVEEDLAAGRTRKLSCKDAKDLYKERLLIGAMGVIEEGQNKFQLIHDGTHSTFMNNRARDHLPGPLVGDLAAELQDLEGKRWHTPWRGVGLLLGPPRRASSPR